jgi:hypothetical protein
VNVRTITRFGALLTLLACVEPRPVGADPSESPEASTTSFEAITTTTGIATTPAMGWPSEAPEALLATRQGILIGGQPSAAADTEVMSVADDLEGGIVFSEGPGPDHDVSWIWWRPAGSDESVPLLEFRHPEHGYLHQVGEFDDGRRLIVTRTTELASGEPEQYLELHDLDPSAASGRRVVQTGGIEWGAQSVSYAGGWFLITEVNHSCGSFYLIDHSGHRLENSSLPEPPCQVHFEVPFLHGRLSPDGSLLAYVGQDFELSQELGYPVVVRSHLTVVRLDTGEEILREQITDSAEHVVISMDFDGVWLVWVRTPPDQPQLPPIHTEVLGLDMEGTRFRVQAEGINSIWLPRAPLQP